MMDLNGQGTQQNPPLPRRFLRLLSMGCGISKSFDPKEVVEASPDHLPHNNPPFCSYKSTTSNCFTGESKPPLVQQGPNYYHHHVSSSSDDRSRPRDSSPVKTNNNVRRGEPMKGEKVARRMEFEDDRSDDERDNDGDLDSREICRGGSPSFREYCIDSDSRSKSMKSDDLCEGGQCKWSSERTLNLEKEKGLENEMGKKERRGKGIRQALQRGRSGGMRNFLSASRRQQQHQNTDFPSPNHDSSQKLLAKAS